LKTDVDFIKGCDLDAFLLSKLDWPIHQNPPQATSAASSVATPVTPPVMNMNSLLLDPLLLKPRRESASQIDEFFEDAVEADLVIGGGRGGGNLSLMGLAERFSTSSTPTEQQQPPSGRSDWDDITTSLSKIDPDNAEMMLTDIGRNLPVKVEPVDDVHQQHVAVQHPSYCSSLMPAPTSTSALSSKQANRMQRFNYSNGFLPPTPPSSDPGSPSQDSPLLRNKTAPPPPYSTSQTQQRPTKSSETEKPSRFFVK